MMLELVRIHFRFHAVSGTRACGKLTEEEIGSWLRKSNIACG